MNIEQRKQSSGLGLIGWIFAVPFILVVIAFLFCEANKAYWDHQVTKMCEEDGGVTVYEKIFITHKQKKSLSHVAGFIVVGPKTNRNKNSPAYTKSFDSVIKKTSPQVIRTEEKIFKTFSDKHVGTIISYARIGGDFPTGFHHSSFRCPGNSDYYKDQEKLFQIMENKE